MTTQPILFSAPMVRALLAGAKFQTRRLLTARTLLVDGAPTSPTTFASLDWDGRIHVDPGPSPAGNPGPYLHVRRLGSEGGEIISRVYPRVQVGDVLWVKETFAPRYFDDGRPGYRADFDTVKLQGLVPEPKWRSSIFMRRADSRISLDVTRVRVERLCDITEEDARAEGIDPEKPLPASINGKPGLVHAFGPDAARRLFAALWDSINGDRGAWASNPWVLVFDFRRVRP